MSNSTKRRGFRSPYLLIFIGVFILAVVAWQFYKYKLVHRGVDKAVLQKTAGLYSLHYDNLSVDEVAGVLHVKNIEVIPDTVMYSQMVKEDRNPHMLLRISIPSLDIYGVKTPKALLTKQIEGGKVEVSNPTIEIELDHLAKDSTIGDPGKELYKELLGKFLKIRVDSVEIVHAKLIVRERRSEAIVFNGENVSFLFYDLLIDSVAARDSSRILFSRNMDLEADEIALPSKNKKYRLHVEKIRFAGKENTLYIGSLRLIPQLSEEEFAKSFPTQKDRYNITLKEIRLVNIDRSSLLHKKLEADQLVVGNSEFRIYHDRSLPPDSVSKVGKYPQQQLMRLSFPLLIRKMVFVHSFIEYKEKNPKSDSAGKVRFEDVSGTVENVTNMKTAIAQDNKCIVSFKARFLGQARVDAKLVLLLGDPQGKFGIEGNIGAIDATALNPLTQPMGLARMEKGRITHLHFDIKATDSSSTGKLLLLYDGIKLSLLKKDGDENKYDKKELPSLAANLFIKKANPEKGGKPRVVDIHYRRALNKSFFNLIWKTVFTGIKESVGMK